MWAASACRIFSRVRDCPSVSTHPYGWVLHLEVILCYDELCAIINLGDANFVAVPVFFSYAPRCLSCHKDTSETALLVVGPFVPDWLAGMKEPSHGRADSSDTTGERGSRHGGNEPSPKT